jgi:hypothetical protein
MKFVSFGIRAAGLNKIEIDLFTQYRDERKDEIENESCTLFLIEKCTGPIYTEQFSSIR